MEEIINDFRSAWTEMNQSQKSNVEISEPQVSIPPECNIVPYVLDMNDERIFDGRLPDRPCPNYQAYQKINEILKTYPQIMDYYIYDDLTVCKLLNLNQNNHYVSKLLDHNPLFKNINPKKRRLREDCNEFKRLKIGD